MPGSLEHSPSDIVSRLLVDLGLGANPGGTWPIHTGYMPNSPDNAIAVFDDTATDQGSLMIDGSLVSNEGIQVLIRAKDHPAGWTKADAIRNGIAKDVYHATVTIDGTSYAVFAFANIGNVLVIGNESPSSKRKMFSVNAEVVITQDS